MVVTWTVVRPFDYLHGPLSFIYNMMLIIKMLYTPTNNIFYIPEKKVLSKYIYAKRAT